MRPFFTSPTVPAAQPLCDLLDAIDRGETTGARLQIAAELLYGLGFDRVVVTLRDASLNPTVVAQAGVPESESLTGLALKPLPGSVWRRRLPHLERFRVDDLCLLDGSDPWVAREFFAAEPVVVEDPDRWLPTDLIVGVMRGARHDVLGIIKLSGPRDGRRPSALLRRDIGAIMRHLAARIAFDALEALARQRHERLQLLQEAGASFARSLDEPEIIRELVRQAQRAVRSDGIAILVPDLHNDILTTTLRVVRGVERTRGPVRLGDGLVAEVARSGRPARAGDRDADRAREKAGLAPPLSMYDIVGESGAASSVLAVPVRVGTRLLAVLAVHASASDVYSAEDEEVLATMASQAATAIANARRYAESERERRTTEALADVARAVGESLRLGEVLRLILRHAVSLLGVEGACIALRTGDYLHIVAAIGSADVLSGVHLPVSGSLIGRSVLSNELVLVNEFGHEMVFSRAMQHLARIQRTIIAPFVTAQGTIGSIAVINRERPFDQDDGKVLQRLADQVSVAIVNARLFEEIERATREWKVAFDSTASGMVVLEESLTVSRCNTRAAELCGVAIPTLLGQRFRNALIGPDSSPDGRAVDAFIARAMQQGVPVRETVRHLATGRLYSLLAAPHPDGGCVITFDDVTESSRLAEQHAKVLDTVSDAIIITSHDGGITFANSAAQVLFARERLVGVLSETLVPGEWLSQVRMHEAAARRGERARYECEVLRSDGSRRAVQVSTAPLYELGEIVGTVACLRDITERRAEATALERSEQRYRRLVDTATDAIFTVDANGRLTSVNPAFLHEAGLTVEQVLGQDFLRLVDPIDRDLADREMRATLRGERCRVQLRCLGASGSRLTTVTTAPFEQDGRVVGALGIVRDITNDEVRREAQVQQARLAAVGQSLGRVANELNNPLASLLAVAELEAASPTLHGDDRRALEQILEEARRASQIVGQLLDTTADTPSPVGGRAPVDLNAVLRRSLEHHGYSLRAAGITVERQLADDLPMVEGDALQLQQVLSNLIVNAEQVLGEHQGARQLVVTSTVQGREVRVTVQDSGPGIPALYLARVTAPMFTTRAARGHRGLGLTIANTIVLDHSGTLDIESPTAGGAAFTVRLPIMTATALSAHAEAVARAESELVARQTPSSGSRPVSANRQRRILLIEDEVTLRTAISRFLQSCDYAVEIAESGAAALAVLAHQQFDLILLDLRMQEMSGERVYEAMQAALPDQAERVVFVTGDLHSEHAAQFIRQTGRPVLAKPFTLTELATRIAQLLGAEA
ncbi:MAG: PAS domain S-box protein [Gemmatimonas sp.]|jgi:PAS domain S-box-containing protein|uniref:PAS domain S-box protein n=1 Tax=Gemmatimonas sp. TaxID=1962908 RepID=UPI00391F37F4|nr:PAS domain S-box protein [Gemmatimonadota bacterium]